MIVCPSCDGQRYELRQVFVCTPNDPDHPEQGWRHTTALMPCSECDGDGVVLDEKELP